MKTSELTGKALDWAVAKCEGVINGDDLDIGFVLEGGYTPSTDWAQGGPIIEREGIQIVRRGDFCWEALRDADGVFCLGRKPLIAAMRCYVASKLGDEVDVPDEILKGNTNDHNR